MQTETIYEQTTARLIEAMEAGPGSWRKCWRGGTGLALRYEGEAYRGGNQMLLLMVLAANGYKSPTFLTYRQAVKAGGHVRKGEKGWPIMFYKTLPARDGDDEDSKRIVGRGYTVFNLDQCDDIEDPNVIDPEAGWTSASDEELDMIVSQFTSRGAQIQHNGRGPWYSPTLDLIEMPKPEAFETRGGYVATLAHECIHSTGHQLRLKRDGICQPKFSRQSPTYAFEELVAELGATFLCARFGIDGEHLDNHAAYLKGWLKILREDKRAIFRAATYAQEAADYLTNEERNRNE